MTIKLKILCSFIFVYLGLSLSSHAQPEAEFRPTRKDILFFKKIVEKIPSSQKLLILADTNHRFPHTRAATNQVVEAITKKYHNEKVCLFLETTPKVNDSIQNFMTGPGDSSPYLKEFKPIADAIKTAANDRKFIQEWAILEPSKVDATYLKKASPHLKIYGVDVDYTSHKIMEPLVKGTLNGRPLDDNQIGKYLVKDRNIQMAKNINLRFKNGQCDRGVLSTGDAHVYRWNGDKKKTPNYTGEIVPGVFDLVDRKLVGKPQVIEIGLHKTSTCPPGGATVPLRGCTPKFSKGRIDLPRNYFESRALLGGFGGTGGTGKYTPGTK